MDTIEKIVNDAESHRYPPELIKQRIDALLEQLKEEVKKAYASSEEDSYADWLEAIEELRKARTILDWLDLREKKRGLYSSLFFIKENTVLVKDFF